MLVFTSQDAYRGEQRGSRGSPPPFVPTRVAGAYGRQLPHERRDPSREVLPRLPLRRRAAGARIAHAEELEVRVDALLERELRHARSTWEAFPFADDIVMSEDQEWSRRVLLAGIASATSRGSRPPLAHVFLEAAFRRFFDSGVSAERSYVAGERSKWALWDAAGRYARGEFAWLWTTRQLQWIPYTSSMNRKVHGPPAGPAAPRASDEPEVPVERLPRILEHVAAEWRTARPHAGRPIRGKLVEAAVVVVAMAAFAIVVAPTLDQPLLERHSFRQTQTAYTARIFHEEGIDLLHPKLPVLGEPFEVPFEFPLFQAAAALVMDAGVDDDLAMRLTGLLCFLLTGGLIYGLVRYVADPVSGVAALVAFLATPFALLWGRASMIEYLATAGAVGFAWATIAWRQNRRPAVAGLALAAGLVGMLVKPTTAVFWIIPALAYRPVGSRPGDGRRGVAVLTALVLVPIAAASLWTRHADAIKAASPTTAWLTSSNLEDWNFGTLAQRLDPGVWGVSRSSKSLEIAARQPCRRRACCLYGIRVRRVHNDAAAIRTRTSAVSSGHASCSFLSLLRRYGRGSRGCHKGSKPDDGMADGSNLSSELGTLPRRQDRVAERVSRSSSPRDCCSSAMPSSGLLPLGIRVTRP